MSITIEQFQHYLAERYADYRNTEGLFMKLFEEMGELAEVINMRTGRKAIDGDIEQAFAFEIVDVLHFALAIASVNHIDLTAAILEKDEKASAKYGYATNLKTFIQQTL
jgi:NTP pyrophosphatase (non-canonical NTP hydrolase)